MLFLLSCQPAQGLHEATLLLGLLSLEAVLEAEATRTLLATADVSPSAAAGGMPIWRVYGGRTCEETLPGGQPLLAAAVELGSEIVGACAAAAAPSLPLAARAVGLLHRLLAHRASSGVGLPAVEWGSLVVRVFDLARCLATHPHLASSPSGAELAARLLGLLHHLLLCSEPLPPAVSDAVAAELSPFCAAGGVCGRLVAIARAGAPALLSSLQLAEPFCVAAPAARVDPDDAPAADLLVAKWRRAAPQAARVAAARAPPSPSARERDAAVQALLRLLIARSRADGSATPMHIEELLSPRKPAAA
uniref:Uncharacterized protein n=2 Tax=Emiliania huxleyi TaxID=2903 RepID=A0A7S3S4P9_EMIHU